ncbi:MAG TPA: hypothetical protein DHV62_06915 [Elusimicrobia bacterium]|jgi:demethylmenaquinone methyltransferase/2-methoxy-6-polyprenyl-1,4-benzoquinol methylase|nr:hypothetical protein [Elusimicrobiota bacterium]
MEYAQTIFNDLAKRYDFFCQIASFFLDRFWRKRINSLIEPGEIILDLGTGTGELAFGINKAEKIIGIDFSWEMLKNAQLKNSKPANQHNEVEFIAADAQRIPFPVESFNSVVSGFVFRHLQKNINMILKEIYRVIKPEGKIIILEFSRPEFAFWRKIYYLYLDVIIPLIGRILFGKEKVKYFRYLQETIINFFSVGELKMILSNNGFRKVGYYPLMGGVVGIYYGFK